jgi:hypothetical protein
MNVALPPRQRSGAEDAVGHALLAGIVIALAVTVFDEIVLALPAGLEFELHYKKVWRLLPLAWLASLLLPAARRTLGPRVHPSDVPLGVFVAVAAVSIALGGGHWGDFRNLLAGVGVGVMARSLFADPVRRRLYVHLMGLTILAILARELWVHPTLLPPREVGRYDLVTANPNVLGFLFAMLLPVLIAEGLACTGPRRALVGVYVVGAVMGTLLTFSRAAALGAAAGTAVVVMRSLPVRTALVLVAAAALAFLAVQRPDRWSALRTEGDTKRVRILATSLSLAAESPLLGTGFGINNLEEVFPDRYEQRYGERVFRFHSMNQLLDVVVGTGAVGAVFFLWWVGRVWTRAVGWLRASTTPSARTRGAGAVAACVAVAVMSFGESPLYHGKLVPLLFLLLAIVEIGPSPHSERTRAPSPPPLARPPA